MDTSGAYGAIHVGQFTVRLAMALIALLHHALQISPRLAMHETANITLHEEEKFSAIIIGKFHHSNNTRKGSLGCIK
jgi:hypothetical protein